MWNDKKQVKKGNMGEEIVKKYLLKKGFTVYVPISDCPHNFDMLTSLNKRELCIYEVKTKAKRNFMPDTGINYSHYLEYKQISQQHNLPVFLVFVDELIQQIYGGFLHDLDSPTIQLFNGRNISYPKIENCKGVPIIFFYQPTMKIIGNLNEEEAKEIKEMNTRNYKYILQQTLF